MAAEQTDVVHLSTFGDGGGAARAARRLHAGLTAVPGVRSRLVVQHPVTPGPGVEGPRTSAARVGALARPRLDAIALRAYAGRRTELFSPALVPAPALARGLMARRPDVVNLHWITDGMVSIEALARLPGELVWTLHDLWPLTGGCHYDGGCRRHRDGCGACPQLGSRRPRDLSALTYARKARAWAGRRMTLVAPSRWLAAEARASPLLGRARVETIANGVDLDVFRPAQRSAARAALGLPADRPLLLFGAVAATADPRKGFDLLAAALATLAADPRAVGLELAVFGAADGGGHRLPLPAHFLGRVDDDARLRLAYAAADVFVAPSREDNLPNTVVEALACGTPVAAFAVGGLPELIDDGATGRLAVAHDPRALAEAVVTLLGGLDDAAAAARRARCRAVAERRYDLADQARRYGELYRDLRRRGRA